MIPPTSAQQTIADGVCRRDTDLEGLAISLRMWRNRLPKAAASLVFMQAMQDRDA
jgi:hypothetical protein